jgi:hypothetical protein
VNIASDRLTAALADRYRIERELGQGGMATVYRAHDIKHERKIAAKVLKPELAAAIRAERFVVEIRTTASLQHPHILPLFDSGSADGFLYYVMPFVDGETLRSKLDRETQLGVDEAVKIATDVADALNYAHEQGTTSEIFVRPYPNTSATVYQVSTAGGSQTRWSFDGREIFYRNRLDSLVTVPVLPGASFALGEERALFSLRGIPLWDIAPDGQRFVVVRLESTARERLIVVENFHEELKPRIKQ